MSGMTVTQRVRLLCDCGGVTPPDPHDQTCAVNASDLWIELSAQEIQDRVSELLAEAWSEGYATGDIHSDGCDYIYEPARPNPYRESDHA